MTIFEKNVLRKQISFNIEFLMNFRDDSAWLCMEKLKKHSFEAKKFKHVKKYIKIIKKYVNN